MESIEMYTLEREDISIHMLMYFNETGQLIFEGQDVGKSVTEYWGDSDYEYFYKIEPSEVEKFYPLLKIAMTDRLSLLLEIKKRFGGNRAYSALGQFMRENNISFSASTWV